LFTGELTWRELWVFIRTSPADSAYTRTLLGPDSQWGLVAQLLAAVHDQLASGNWQRSGGKGPRPKPLPRPGIKQPQQYGKTQMAPEVVAALMARAAGRAVPADVLELLGLDWIAERCREAVDPGSGLTDADREWVTTYLRPAMGR
jgi:hypothetical protein